MSLSISLLSSEDRAGWEALACEYKAFYNTVALPAEYETAWNRLLQQEGVYGIGAKVDGRLVGIAHFLFHTNVWAPKICYLQDLFVSSQFRGQGTARALIESVAAIARQARASRCYWLVQEHNTVARELYDKVAQFSGFIRYDFPLWGA